MVDQYVLTVQDRTCIVVLGLQKMLMHTVSASCLQIIYMIHVTATVCLGTQPVGLLILTCLIKAA